MKNKIIGIALAVMAMAVLGGCGGGDGDSKTSPSPANSASASAPASTGEATDGGGDSGAPADVADIAESPVLLTSVGQSADVDMVKTIMDKAEISTTMKKDAKADEVGEYKTLVLAVGGSSKGLGAAGIDADQELERVQALIDAADSAGLTIITMHIGGSQRRGELSDKFIGPAFAKADYALVLAEGDQDGMMAGLAKSGNVPIDIVESLADLVEPLKTVFK